MKEKKGAEKSDSPGKSELVRKKISGAIAVKPRSQRVTCEQTIVPEVPEWTRRNITQQCCAVSLLRNAIQ